MKSEDLIGKRVKQIYVWSKMNQGGLDEGEVYIKTDDGNTYEIPHHIETPICNGKPRRGSVRLFSFWNNRFWHLRGKKITDIVMVQESFISPTCFIMLSTGDLFAEISMAPQGMGAAGIQWFKNIKALKAYYDELNCIRLTDILKIENQ